MARLSEYLESYQEKKKSSSYEQKLRQTMKYTPFHEQRFRSSVDKALKQVKTILDNTRNPRLAEDEEHTYDDKYALVEFLTNTSVASQMNALQRLGLDPEKFKAVSDWVHNDKKTVSLRFKARDSCSFLKERDVDIVTGTREIEQETTEASTSSFMGMTSGNKTEKVTAKVITKVKEYHWKVEMSYSISIFAGSDPTNSVELDSRSSSTVVVTSGGQVRPGSTHSKPLPPIPEVTDHPAVDANVTWFFRMIQPQEQICQFKVDRTNPKSCKTPRRNKDVDAAFELNKALMDWSSVTHGFFVQRVEREILGKHNPIENKSNSNPSVPDSVEPGTCAVITGLQKEPTFNGKNVTICEYLSSQNRYRVEPLDKSSGLPGTLLIKPQNVKIHSSPHGPPLSGISDATLFCPVIPLMENKSVLSMAEVGDFLTEQCRSMDDAIDGLSKTYSPRPLVRLVSVAEATAVLLCRHLQDLATSYQDSVDYVENMLKQQLIQAIGKEINNKDFDQFMVFHNDRLFGPDFTPKPFSYAIRRPGHYPDGILAIESTKQQNEPIHSWVRQVPGNAAPSLFMPLSAATSIEITGDRFLHGWMQHQFKTKSKNEHQIVARARQFSSFILILGTMLGADKFDPKNAIILQNKDEVLIPLLTNTLPSAKEFRDSIASLSPEQKEFARAYRAMQLETSVFGICIIQLKPQLEKLLGLPENSLTKEIQLTQDLMSLFVDYQIPSDLMTYEGPTDSDTTTKVSAVKGYVKSIMDVIDNAKEKQLIDEERKADMRAERASPNTPRSFTSFTRGSAGSTPSAPPLADAAAFTPTSFKRSFNAQAAELTMMDEMDQAQASPASGRLSGRRLAKASTKQASFKSPTKSSQAAKRTAHTIPAASVPSVQLETVQPPAKTRTTEVKPLGPTEGQDFTIIPKILDSCIEKFDSDNALRSTVIKPGAHWKLTRQDNLLVKPSTSSLSGNATDNEKKKAFDLLDAISRSGVLPIDCAELHVVIGVSHCFDNDVMGSIVQDNLNPIEKVERSGVMIASTIHAQPPKALIRNEQETLRLTTSFPLLLESGTLDERNAGVAHIVEKLNKSTSSLQREG